MWNEVQKVNVSIIKVAGFESKERLHSPEIKEDDLRFVEIINPFKVAGFESKERLRSWGN